MTSSVARCSRKLRSVPGDAAVDPNSELLKQGLIAAANDKGFVIAASAWTVPLYTAVATTPRFDVTLTAPWRAADFLLSVPIPAGAAPDPQADAHLCIIDLSTLCEFDFWQASQDAAGNWSASWGNRIEANADGNFPLGNAARGSSFALGAGLIRPEEMAAGEIRHALVFSYPTTKAGGPVPPSNSSDGTTTSADALPEGARVQLDPALDLTALALEPWQKTVAVALQKYGMYLGDTGGAVSLYAQHPQSASVPYPWGTETYPALPVTLVSSLRVLALPAQAPSLHEIAPSPCGDFAGLH